MTRKHEKPEVDCRVLVEMLARDRDDDKRMLLLDDFLWKSGQIGSDARFFWETQALRSFVPDQVSSRFGRGEVPMHTPQVDVAIVTVKKPELLAAKLAFDIDPLAYENDNLHGLRCWKRSVEMSPSRQELDVLITMVGEEGNVSCAAACDRLFNTYQVGLCILVGVAAGVEEKVRLGDVVTADIVLDYERARLEPDGPKKRPRQFGVRIKIGRDVEYFEPERFGWHDCLTTCFSRLREDAGAVTPDIEEEWKPIFHNGVILSGEKLIADATIDNMRNEFHDRIRAAEMEGAGFARLCEEHDIVWLVFRGISDFGNPEKDDVWQSTSALAAATAARVFLENGYRKPE